MREIEREREREIERKREREGRERANNKSIQDDEALRIICGYFQTKITQLLHLQFFKKALTHVQVLR